MPESPGVLVFSLLFIGYGFLYAGLSYLVGRVTGRGSGDPDFSVRSMRESLVAAIREGQRR